MLYLVDHKVQVQVLDLFCVITEGVVINVARDVAFDPGQVIASHVTAPCGWGIEIVWQEGGKGDGHKSREDVDLCPVNLEISPNK